jgi:hypothetical protein
MNQFLLHRKKTQTANNTLGTGFTVYEVNVEDGTSGDVSTAFQKTLRGDGTLKIEIVADGEVAVEREASAGSGAVAASWSLRARRQRRGLN